MTETCNESMSFGVAGPYAKCHRSSGHKGKHMATLEGKTAQPIRNSRGFMMWPNRKPTFANIEWTSPS